MPRKRRAARPFRAQLDLRQKVAALTKWDFVDGEIPPQFVTPAEKLRPAPGSMEMLNNLLF